MRRLAGTLTALPIVWGAISSPLDAAQSRCDELDRRLAETEPIARRYAPIFWFAPGERYFPTMPFLSAFDGVDDEGLGTPGPVDMADPGEIAAIGPDGRPSWDLLHSRYTAQGGVRTRYAAVLYRVRTLDAREIDHLWRYLISDEQAWARLRRLEDLELLSALRADTTKFLSVEYHSYDMRDFGLVGHYWDTEYTQLYVPASPALADRFRVIIGAGHTERVPNNVLVLSGEAAEREKGSPPVILVELGTHATAPDVRPFGLFQPGLDANWHVHDVWGTRDAVAMTGVGAVGRYDVWMTFPRTQIGSTVLKPPAVDERSMWMRLTEGVEAFDSARSDTRTATYALVPAEPLECVSDAIAEDSVDVAAVERWLELVADALRDSRPEWNFVGFRGLSAPQKRAAIEAMRRWEEGLFVSNAEGGQHVGADKILLWRSKHYRSPPSAALKQHLFRPVAGSLQRFSHYLDLLNLWVTWHPTSAVMVQAGFEIPAFWLPLRLPGYLETQIGVYFACGNLVETCGRGRTAFAASLQHTGHYRVVTWYGRITFVPERERVVDDASAADWLIAGGLTVPLRPVRIRMGLSTDFEISGPRPDDVRWELVISRL